MEDKRKGKGVKDDTWILGLYAWVESSAIH